LQLTAPDVTDTTYTFTNVVPNSGGYYVTQFIGGEESVNSNWVNSNLGTPTVTAGTDYVDVSGVYSGATVSLYTESGSFVSDTPTLQPGGEYRFEALVEGTSYYAIQEINGVVSLASTVVNIATTLPSAPTVTAGTESIIVTGFTSGATLKLYPWTGGSALRTETNVTVGSFTFTDVEPDSSGYYITQTVEGKESLNSNWANSSLGTPTIAAGTDYVDVSGVYTGATVSLYTESGSFVSDTPTLQPGGEYRFEALEEGISYYAIQEINGVVSLASTVVTIATTLPSAPTVTAGTESIIVTGFTSGATLKLYPWTGGSALRTETNVTVGSYTFTDVEPDSSGYYITQTVEGKESLNSNWVNSSLGTPTIAAGTDYVDVSGVYTGATVSLYTESGSFVSDTPTLQPGGEYRFQALVEGTSYYAIQEINGVVSLASTVVTIATSLPSAPTVTAGTESIIVNGFTSGAILKLYPWTGGSALRTETNVTVGSFTFTDVEPDSSGYYVTQTVEGKESLNSTWVNSNLRTPTIAAGVGYADIGGIYPGATVKLYTELGVLVSDNPTVLPGGTFRFEGLTKGAAYFVQQVFNGVVSDASAIVVIPINRPAPPTALAGTECIIVTNFISGATLKLYLWDGGSVVRTVNNVIGSSYIFTGVEAIDTGYYVTQTVDGDESENSNWITSRERVVYSDGQDTTGTTNTEKITVEVKEGNTDNTAVNITIQRETGENGQKSDTVNYENNKAAETVNKLKEAGKDTARIVIPDEKDEVSETKINIPSDTVNTLVNGAVNLQIDTEEAKIGLSKESLGNISRTSKEDLYFHLVPVKDDLQKEAVINQAVFQATLVSGNKNSNAAIIGNPVTIETNMPSTAADITLPLTGITFPTDPKEKADLLQQLAVYIEHSDGEKELVQGELVEYKDGVYGIRFHINKFSTFTVVKTNAFVKSSEVNLLKVITPAKASLRGTTITATVVNETASVTVKLKVSEKATWKLYSNKACTKEISGNRLSLKEGVNVAYVKVTAEDGTTSKIYTLKITRKAAEYKEHIMLGLIGSKAYAEKVAKIFAEEYDCKNVTVTKEGKYYRVAMDFRDKATAIKACEDMIDREYILHYHFVKKNK
jgi:hypothetical protein